MDDLCLLLQGFIFICATGAAPKLLLVTLCTAWCPLAWTGHGERKYLGLSVIFYSDTQWKNDVWGFLGRAFFLLMDKWRSGFSLRSSVTTVLQPVLLRDVISLLIYL